MSSGKDIIVIVMVLAIFSFLLLCIVCLIGYILRLRRNLRKTRRELSQNGDTTSARNTSFRSTAKLQDQNVNDHHGNVRDVRTRNDEELSRPLSEGDAQQSVRIDIELSGSDDQLNDPDLTDVDRTQVNNPGNNWPTLPDDLRLRLNTIPQIRDIRGIDLVSVNSEKTILHISYLGQDVRQAHMDIRRVSGLMETQYDLILLPGLSSSGISGSLLHDETRGDFTDHTESVPSNRNHDSQHQRSFGPQSGNYTSNTESSCTSNSLSSGECSWRTSLKQSLKDTLLAIDSVQSVDLVPDYNADVNEVRDRTGKTASELDQPLYIQITYTGTSVTDARKIIRDRTGLEDKQFILVLKEK